MTCSGSVHSWTIDHRNVWLHFFSCLLSPRPIHASTRFGSATATGWLGIYRIYTYLCFTLQRWEVRIGHLRYELYTNNNHRKEKVKRERQNPVIWANFHSQQIVLGWALIRVRAQNQILVDENEWLALFADTHTLKKPIRFIWEKQSRKSVGLQTAIEWELEAIFTWNRSTQKPFVPMRGWAMSSIAHIESHRI